MNRKAKRKLNKSVVKNTKLGLAALLAVETLGIAIIPAVSQKRVKELKGEAITNATGRKTSNVNGVNISLDQTLDDNGDGTYTLKLKSSSNLKFEDLSVKKTKIKYGYYEAPQTGNYLVEIFGGNGARGQNTLYSQGGEGGRGAHLYANIALDQGDILCYTIGGNGQTTLSNDTGGGANGDGGNHGDSGSYYVGGGGGYTVVYLFKKGSEADDFYSKYVTNGVVSLEDSSKFEADRISKYIMIAGGGGGGGAGNAFSVVDKAVRKPDGGSAGDYDSPHGVLGEEYAVPGTYYAGSDGFSSGKRQDYVGKGGAELPGAVNSTHFELFSGKEPNDWKGTMNSKLPGGAGGAGNLRGGAGGAGYAGGSGGIMTGLLIGTNVGGGGGGSSFLASSTRTDIVIPSAGDDAMKYVSGTNDSDEGGAVYISYMPTEADFKHLDDLTINGEISQYFNIESCTSDNGDVTVTGQQIKVENVKSSPSFLGGTGKSTTITMKLKPIDGFMGGNDVPIFKPVNNKQKVTYTSFKGTFDIDIINSCGYVNVPYAFDLQTHSYVQSGSAKDPYTGLKASDLFEDNKYIEKKSNIGYDFIQDISDYKITSGGKTISKSQQLSISETTIYNISYTVTPKAGSKAIVGEKLTTKVYSKDAKVSIVSISDDSLNGNQMKYNKTLNYDPKTGYYIFTVNATATLPSTETIKLTSGSGNVTIDHDGYYLIQAWGGSGGEGGDPYISGTGRKSSPSDGGYIYEWVLLQENDVINYSVGARGEKGNRAGGIGSAGGQGYGGYGSYVRLTRDTLTTNILAAAGGGGGGGARVGGGDNATAVNNDTYTNVYDESKIRGTAQVETRDTEDGGQGGVNYKNEAFIADNHQSVSVPIFTQNISDYKNKETGGAIYLTPLLSANQSSNFGVNASFTSEFVIDKVLVDGNDESVAPVISADKTSVSNIKLVTKTSNNVTSGSFSVSYYLLPSTSCLGGTDIKLLNSSEIVQDDCDGFAGNDKITIKAQDPTDYANVRINPNLLNEYNFELETFDKDYVQGEPAINTSTLYNSSTSFVNNPSLTIKEASSSFAGGSTTVNPNQTTDYSISYGIESAKQAEKAVVGPNVDPLLIEKNARVNVYNKLDYSLDNVTCDAVQTEINGNLYYLFTPGQDYEVELEPTTGMELKADAISVTDNGTTLEDDKFSVENGLNGALMLTIDGSALTSTSKIVISAKATVRTFTLHYLVSVDASGYVTKDFTVQLPAGATGSEDFDPYLEALLANYPAGDAPEVKGYEFVVEYPDGTPLTSMPAYDVWINGVYVPLSHDLEIHYVNSAGEEIATPYIENEGSCYYKKDIDVVTPEVSKYAPASVHVGSYTGEEVMYNPSRIQFSMPDDDVKLYVVYDSIASGGLVINYTSKDKITIPAQHSETGVVGQSYSVTLPKIDGYVPVIYDEEGEMTKLTSGKLNGTYLEDGELVTITYEPQTYTISFYDKAVDGTQLFEDRTVFFNHELGYTGESYENATFTNLPTPVKVGYEFKGWMLNGFLVDALSTYDLTEDAVLTPTWEEATYTVTVRYFADSGKPTLPDTNVLSGKYGETYELTHPTVSGYHLTEETTILSGTFTGSNIIVDVTYLQNAKLNGLDVEGYDEEITFSGESYKPELTITHIPEGTDVPEELIEGTDYIIIYDETSDVGEHKITIKFIGECEGNEDLELYYEIVEKNISKDDESLQITGINDSYPYNGTAIEPVPTITYNGTTLVKGTDYELSYVDNVSLSDETNKPQVIVTFKGNYEGQFALDFEIVPSEIEPSKVGFATIDDRTYNGLQHTPTTTVTYNGTTLTPGVDYEFTYGENIHVGKGYVYVNFKGGFAGSAPFEIQFNIVEKVVGEDEQSSIFTITPDISDPIVRPNNGLTPDLMPITILDNETGKELRSPEDFIVVVDGEGLAHIEFKGDYKNSDPIEITYSIEDVIAGSVADQTYTGNTIEPKPVITFNGETLVEGEDYILHYDGNSDVGMHTIVVEYINDFEGVEGESIDYNVVANEINVSELTIEDIDPQTFTGSQLTPSVVVKYGDYTLVYDKDYSLSYGENIHVGEDAGSVIITLKGGFKAEDDETSTVYFDILPKQVDDSQTDFIVEYEDGETYPSIPTVKDGDNTLRYPEDFEVIYDGDDEGTIVFKGDYEGNEPIKFEIEKEEIDVSELITEGPADVTFDGTQHKPTDIVVKYNGVELVKGVEYELTYGENVHAGLDAGEVYVTLIGGFKAENDEKLTLYFDILPKQVGDSETDFDVTPQAYPNAPIVKDGDITLRNPEDFEIIYDGSDEGTIVFKGDYEGNDPVTFKVVITTVDVEDLLTSGPKAVTYDGTQKTPTDIVVSYNGYTLIKDVDYTLSYGENIHVGKNVGEVYITLIGGFKAENSEKKTVYFDINPRQVGQDGFEITPEGTEQNPIQIPETGGEPDPRPITIVDTETSEILTEGEDFIIEIDEDNEEIVIKFINDYEGNDPITEKYEKIPGDISENLDVEDIPDQEYNPDGNEPKPEIKLNGELLEEGEDYELEYGEDEDGNPEVIVHFKDNYSETPDLHLPYEIVPKDLSNPEIVFETTSSLFDGEAVEPGITVKDGDHVLEEGVDYIIHYTNNTQPGVGKAIVEFIGNYASTSIKTAEFDIRSSRLDNSATTADGRATVVLLFEEGFDPDISLTAQLRETVSDEMKDQAKLGGRFYGTYGDYEIKLLDKDGNEIQPSDIKEGTVLTLMIQLPSELEGRDFSLVHYHSADDVSLIVRGEEAAIGTYIITEEGYIMTLVNKFSDFSIIYEETCLAHWFLITAAILDILLIAAIIIMGKKQSKVVGIAAVVGLAVITGVSAIFAHCTLCYVMLGINGLLILFNVLFFAMWKGKEEPQVVQPAQQVVYVQAPAAAAQVVQAAPVQAAPAPVPQEALTLKESMAQAASVATTALTINKVTVAKWLEETYGEKVVINHRGNMTSTGLPLADTHYIEINGEKKCFIYIYEVDGKCFFIVKSDDATAEKVRGHNHKMISSAFPKTRDYAKWYTMLIDDSYACNDSVFATLKFIISRLGVAQTVAPAPVAPVVEEKPVVEEVKADLSLKESISEAKVASTNVEVNKASIAKFLSETYGDKVVVNTRENMTSTGLPLADTHYIYMGENKKCFIYVYEVEGSCFCIVRSDEEVAKVVKGMGHKFVSSAFPKTRDYAKWYTMLFDESYKSSDDVFAAIKVVVDALNGEKPTVKEEVPVVEETKADLSLKESISEAKEAVTSLSINKEVVAKYLSEKYGKQVVVNTRENMTSTGLPLADTHYLYIGEDKKCFIYVYDIDGSCFFIVRGNEEIAKVVKGMKHRFVSSAFPKTRDYAKWFTMLIDESYKSNEDVFKALDAVVEGLLGKSEPVVEEPVIDEVKADLSLKESICEAKETFTKLEVNKEVVAKYLSEKYGKQVVVNTRENMTSTGLPLADTHYLYIGDDKKCFIYVYDIDGSCFFIVRGNEEIAKAVKGMKHKFISSAFPKTRDYAKWYTMLIDNSYASNEEVFKALDVVVEGLLGGSKEVTVVEEEPEVNDLSLKESMAKAAEVKGEVEMNKKNIAEWLKETYGDKVTVNVRESMTSTGLPLADTHYIEVDGIKKCFIYIYEVNGNCFAIVRSDEETAKMVKAGKHKFISSAFPKTRDYAKWYTMLFDKSYASSDEVFETLKKVIDNIKLK